MKKKINTQRQKQALYESIMRQVAPEIRKALRESEEVNEGLFGFGDPSKPSEELTAEYIRSHSQEEIAEKISISRQAYAKWESGVTIPDVEKCSLLADVYGVGLRRCRGRIGRSTPSGTR